MSSQAAAEKSGFKEKWDEFSTKFWDVGPLPKRDQDDRQTHQLSIFTNVFYTATAFLLIYGTKTPALGMAVSWPGIFSSVYHGYAYFGDNEKWVQGLMVADILSIIIGVAVGLGLNAPAPSPGWWTLLTIMMWEAGSINILTHTDQGWHPWWHVLSVLPVIFYAWLDLEETEHPDRLFEAARVFAFLSLGVWFLSCLMPLWDYVRGYTPPLSAQIGARPRGKVAGLQF